MSQTNRRALIVALGTCLLVLLAGCGSETGEQSQVVPETPTAIPTTAPIALPTSTPAPTATPVPPPTATPVPQPTATPLPPPTVVPTTPPTPTVAPAAAPATASDAAPVATATVAPQVIETPTPLPTATLAEPTPEQAAVDPTSTVVAEAPTAVVVASGEPPLECFDRDVQVYRAHVEGVDVLSFESGRVYCSGAGTNDVSAAASYRHSSGLVVQRNADYITDSASGGYIPYSGTLHFCMNGQPSSASVRADRVPSLLVVIDNEAQRLVAQGASRPAAFNGGSAQC